jgi:hypothetical protein
MQQQFRLTLTLRHIKVINVIVKISSSAWDYMSIGYMYVLK